MRPQLSQGNHMNRLSGVCFGTHGIKNPRFVLVSLNDDKIGSIIDYAYRNGIPQLIKYDYEQFRYLHESIPRAGGGLSYNNQIWLVMDSEKCILFKLKYISAIVGIVGIVAP